MDGVDELRLWLHKEWGSSTFYQPTFVSSRNALINKGGVNPSAGKPRTTFSCVYDNTSGVWCKWCQFCSFEPWGILVFFHLMQKSTSLLCHDRSCPDMSWYFFHFSSLLFEFVWKTTDIVHGVICKQLYINKFYFALYWSRSFSLNFIWACFCPGALGIKGGRSRPTQNTSSCE